MSIRLKAGRSFSTYFHQLITYQGFYTALTLPLWIPAPVVWTVASISIVRGTAVVCRKGEPSVKDQIVNIWGLWAQISSVTVIQLCLCSEKDG